MQLIGARLCDDTLTTAPELRPYSASNVLLITRNSSIASGVGWMVGRFDELIVSIAAVDAKVVGAAAACRSPEMRPRHCCRRKYRRSNQAAIARPAVTARNWIGVARVERKFVDRAIIDDSSELRAAGIDQRGFGGHIHITSCAAPNCMIMLSVMT